MKRNFTIIIIMLIAMNLNSQIATDYGFPVIWKYNNPNCIMSGIDSLTNDSLILTTEKYLRKNSKNKVIEELIIDNSNNLFLCDDDGYKLSGYWKSFYKSGEIKEFGKYRCNIKIGEWMYFYKNGQIKKYENYLKLDIFNNPNLGSLSGIYIEYYKNKKVKIIGNYKIIEVLKHYQTVDKMTYQIKDSCCYWGIKSIKNGVWREYDSKGNLLKEKLYDINTFLSDTLREITEKFVNIID